MSIYLGNFGGIDIDVDVNRGRMANILPTLFDVGKAMSIDISINVNLCGSNVNPTRSTLVPHWIYVSRSRSPFSPHRRIWSQLKRWGKCFWVYNFFHLTHLSILNVEKRRKKFRSNGDSNPCHCAFSFLSPASTDWVNLTTLNSYTQTVLLVAGSLASCLFVAMFHTVKESHLLQTKYWTISW
jgi:hypothetical protein